MNFGLDMVWADYYTPEVLPLLVLISVNLVIFLSSWVYKRRRLKGINQYRRRSPRILLMVTVSLASCLFLIMSYHYIIVIRPDVRRFNMEHPGGHYHHNLSFLDHPIGWIILLGLTWGIPVLTMLNWKRGDAVAKQFARADTSSRPR